MIEKDPLTIEQVDQIIAEIDATEKTLHTNESTKGDWLLFKRGMIAEIVNSQIEKILFDANWIPQTDQSEGR